VAASGKHTDIVDVDEVRKLAKRFVAADFYSMDASAVSYMFENPNPSQLTPAQIDKEIDLTQQVPSKHLRHGCLMQNLAEEFGRFSPAPAAKN
jgi:hypothetical protein